MTHDHIADAITALEARVAEMEEERREAERWAYICGALDEFEAAKGTRNKSLEDGLARAVRVRATFCTASPGTDEEFNAWLHGFDTAIRAMKEPLL